VSVALASSRQLYYQYQLEVARCFDQPYTQYSAQLANSIMYRSTQTCLIVRHSRVYFFLLMLRSKFSCRCRFVPKNHISKQHKDLQVEMANESSGNGFNLLALILLVSLVLFHVSTARAIVSIILVCVFQAFILRMLRLG
jgi:hypothetical protein